MKYAPAPEIFLSVKYIMEFYENLFIYLTYLYWFLFVFTYAFEWGAAQYYFPYVRIIYESFVATTLAVLFNPFANPKLTKQTQKMIFTGATSLLMSITGGFLIKKIYAKTRKEVKHALE